MTRTHRTTCKSIGRLPIIQLAPQNVPQPQESQPNIPQEASPEEEPFQIELVVPESPTAQDSPAEEQQQPEDQDTEDKTNEEHPPSSDTEAEKIYRDADKVESFGAESPVIAGRLRALLEHLGKTTAPRYRIKEVPCSGRVSSRPSQRFSLDPGSSTDTRDQPSRLLAMMLLRMPPGRPSHRGSVATRADCRTRSTTSCPTGGKMNSRPTG
jgi:hypothetical protein